jgi:hypothetical protein
MATAPTPAVGEGEADSPSTRQVGGSDLGFGGLDVVLEGIYSTNSYIVFLL